MFVRFSAFTNIAKKTTAITTATELQEVRLFCQISGIFIVFLVNFDFDVHFCPFFLTNK